MRWRKPPNPSPVSQPKCQDMCRSAVCAPPPPSRCQPLSAMNLCVCVPWSWSWSWSWSLCAWLTDWLTDCLTIAIDHVMRVRNSKNQDKWVGKQKKTFFDQCDDVPMKIFHGICWLFWLGGWVVGWLVDWGWCDERVVFYWETGWVSEQVEFVTIVINKRRYM